MNWIPMTLTHHTFTRTSLAAATLAMLLTTGAPAASAAEPVDCSTCRETCRGRGYPADAHPDLRSGGLVHRTPEARAAFEAGVQSDPGLGGGDARQAVAAYKRAVVIDPDNAQYRNHLAAALLTIGSIDEAIYNLERATALVPSETKYIVNLGYAWHRSGDEQRALVWYMRALIIDPRNARARLFTGYALELLGMRSEATREFHRVLLEDPDNAGAKRALARLGFNASPATTTTPPPASAGDAPPAPLDPASNPAP